MQDSDRRQPVGSGSNALHRFTAVGRAPFVRASRGCAVEWEIPENFVLVASGGLADVSGSLHSLGAGTYRITALEISRLRAEYACPVYLMKYDKLKKIMRGRYDFEILLQSDWRENVWPYVFDHFMEYGQWPTKKKEYAQLFRRILKKTEYRKMSAEQKTGRFGKLRERIISGALTRLDRARSAEKLATAADRIFRDLLASEFYEDLLAEADMFRSIPGEDSIAPLAGEMTRDELNLKLPFELACPRRILIGGPVWVEYMWEYGEAFEKSSLCSRIELYPRSPFVLSPDSRVFASHVQVPLDAGHKVAYGFSSSAPLICKGRNVRLKFSANPPKPSKKSGRGDSDDMTDLLVKLQGIEA